MSKIKEYLILYLAFCLIGTVLEGLYGFFWSYAGTTPWIYPRSFLRYTSLEMLPLWGFSGLICVCIYRAIVKKDIGLLLPELPCLMVVAALWIMIYSAIFQ